MKHHFSLLDPLRFGAALAVAVFHLMFYSWAGASIGAPQGFETSFAADIQFPNAAPFTWFGWVGVEAVRVEKAEDIAGAVAKAVATGRPYLVEIAIEGKR